MKAVLLHSRSRGTARVVAIILGDHTNDAGTCWPSQARMAAMANTSVRRVRAALERLKALGELHVEKYAGPHGVHLYHLTIEPRTKSSAPAESSAQDENGNGPDARADVFGPSTGRFRSKPRSKSSAKPSEENPKEPPGACGDFPDGEKSEPGGPDPSGVNVLALPPEKKKPDGQVEEKLTGTITPNGKPMSRHTAFIDRGIVPAAEATVGHAHTPSSQAGSGINASWIRQKWNATEGLPRWERGLTEKMKTRLQKLKTQYPEPVWWLSYFELIASMPEEGIDLNSALKVRTIERVQSLAQVNA